MDTPETGEFHISSFSGGGNCVEVADGRGGGKIVRDSKSPQDGSLAFGADGWACFVTVVKANRSAR